MSVLSQVLLQLPAFLIALSGFVLAGLFMSKARTSAILVIIAGILTLLQSAFATFNQVILLEQVVDGEMTSDVFSIISGAGYTLFYILISALLLAAVFTGRNSQPALQPQSASRGAETHPLESSLMPHHGSLILTLGLLGLLLFAPLGILAWVLGNKDLTAMEQGRMDKSGEGLTSAGKVLGIIACALMIVGAVIFFGVIAILAESYRGF